MNYQFSQSRLPLKQRILENYEQFDRYDEIFSDNFKFDLNQPILMLGKSVIEKLKGKKVLIIGDFDCDGICATTIMKKLLDDLQIQSNYYIPSRFKEGYGLDNSHVQKAIDFGFDVLLTVDNGIVAHEALKKAKEAGIYTIVIDHHEYVELPDADYILHGKLLSAPYQKACASGLVYLLSRLFKEDELSLVYAGIATNADMVEVLGYNRYLIKKAYQILNEGNIATINALSGKKKNYTYDDLSFLITSKINSVSRLDNASNVNIVPRFLLSTDDNVIKIEAEKIKKINQLRKDLSDAMSERAIKMVDDASFNVIYDEHFQEGLCGLVANRISRSTNKPCIVLADGLNLIKGSGRSVGDFDILAHLKNFEQHFETLGGHKQAVGVSLKKTELTKLQKALSECQIEIGEKVCNCLPLYDDELNDETLDLLLSLQPFGTGFEEPLFYLDNLEVKSRYLIKQMYTKFQFTNGLGAISFQKSDYTRDFSRIVGYLKEDSYRKNRLSMQIQALF